MKREKLVDQLSKYCDLRKKVEEGRRIAEKLLRNFDKLGEVPDSRLGSYYNLSYDNKDSVHIKLCKLYDIFQTLIYYEWGGTFEHQKYHYITSELLKKIHERTMTEREYNVLLNSSTKEIRKMIERKKFDYIDSVFNERK